MTYQEWMNKVNELLKLFHKQQVRNKFTYRAFRTGQSPESFVSGKKG